MTGFVYSYDLMFMATLRVIHFVGSESCFLAYFASGRATSNRIDVMSWRASRLQSASLVSAMEGFESMVWTRRLAKS